MRSRAPNPRVQGVLAIGLAVLFVLVAGAAALRFVDRSDRESNPTPTALALVTALPTSVLPATPAVPPTETRPAAASPDVAPTPNPNDKWGSVIEQITSDKSAVMFRESIARDGVVSGSAITKKPGTA